jgi:type IV pilus assembly protein PilB
MATRGRALSPENFLVGCWNCLGEFDAISAVWCSDDPKNPTKLCPFCFRCFCAANERYKQEFWRQAPQRLKDELNTLGKSKDKLGDILIRMKKLTTPQLLEALLEQKKTGKKLGEVLAERGFVTADDISAALKSQGVSPLADTRGVAYAASPVWEQSGPDAIIQYILNLAARKGASDVQVEPKEDAISVKYRIDDFFFRVDPIPKSFQKEFTQKLFEVFRLDPEKSGRPQTSRTTGKLGETDYDLVAQTLPTPHGVSAAIKLVNRATFMKELPTLGLELEDRVRLLEELKSSFGLHLITGPVFNGAQTTAYSIMSFMLHNQRDVVSLEAPIQWPMEGARQVDVEVGSDGPKMEETIRSVIAVRPEVLFVSSLPDLAAATLAAQLGSSIVVVALMQAQSAAQAVTSLLQMGVPRQLLAGSLASVTCQRLVRQICRICRQRTDPPAAQTLAMHGIGPEEAGRLQFFKGKGCPTCNKVGYRGRQAIFEVLTGTAEVRSAVLSGLAASEIESMGVGTGMTTLPERCLALVQDGVTTFDEYVRLRL